MMERRELAGPVVPGTGPCKTEGGSKLPYSEAGSTESGEGGGDAREDEHEQDIEAEHNAE